MKSHHLHSFGPPVLALAFALALAACAPTQQGGVKSAQSVTDDTVAVQAMIDAGRVIPAGTFNVTYLHGGTVTGSGRDSTILKEIKAGGSYIPVVKMADHAVLQDLTIDDVGGIGVGGGMSYSTVQRVKVIAGGIGTPGKPWYALYYSHAGATPTAPIYSVGNQIIDTVIEDGVLGDDGFSFSFQTNALIKNITHHGSRLALYVSTYVTVDGYDFTPTPFTGNGNYGLAINARSNHLTINGFRAPNSRPRIGHGISLVAAAIVFSGLVVDQLQVSDVTGLLVDGCTCSLSLYPVTYAELTVSNSQIRQVIHLTYKSNITWINTLH